MNGGKLEVLGWGQKWKGTQYKLDLMREYLQNLHDDEIVCFVDGYDVIILQPIEQLEKMFKDTKRNIIFSRDCDKTNNFIFDFLLKWYFGECKQSSLNSGTYIGYVKDLKQLYRQIYEKYDTTKENDDQIILTKICNQSDIVTIDFDRKIFLVTNDYDINAKHIKVQNKQLMFYNHFPCILHATGNRNLNEILENMGYNITKIKRRNDVHYIINTPWFYYYVKLIAGVVFVILLIYIIYRLLFKH